VNLVAFLFIGLLAGWLSGLIAKGRGFGLVGNLIVGLVGAFIGGWLFPLLGLSAAGFLSELIMAVAGALVLLFIVGLARKS